VPFYDGSKSNVIPVYENSYYFQGYVAQGFKSFFQQKFTHYFFIGDDVLLNPDINEKNYTQYLSLENNSCFFPGFINIHACSYDWPRVGEAFRYSVAKPGVEINDQLPTYDIALQFFEKHGLSLQPLGFNQLMRRQSFPKLPYQLKKLFHYAVWKLKWLRHRNKKYHLTYPLVGGYSDIFVVSSNTIKKFCHYCGVFSSTDLFVELAIPTALVFSATKIIGEEDLKLKGKTLWVKEDFKILDKYENTLAKLLSEFPSECLYIHPVKLSQWIS
jgi:hypothetical protein